MVRLWNSITAAAVLMLYQIPGADIIAEYASLGEVGILMLVIMGFLVAIFKDPPYLYTKGRHDSELNSEREKTRLALEAKEEAERDALQMGHRYERLLSLIIGDKGDPTQRSDGDA